jgi:hypothetical protein
MLDSLNDPGDAPRNGEQRLSAWCHQRFPVILDTHQPNHLFLHAPNRALQRTLPRPRYLMAEAQRRQGR